MANRLELLFLISTISRLLMTLTVTWQATKFSKLSLPHFSETAEARTMSTGLVEKSLLFCFLAAGEIKLISSRIVCEPLSKSFH